MNPDTITDRVIAVDFGTSLSDMIAAGKYGWVHPGITPDKFPIKGAGKKQFRAKLFHFRHFVSSEDAVAAMKAENYTPATHVHCLAFGAAFPEEQRNYSIVCLGSSARGSGYRRVVCLTRYDGGRRLRLVSGIGDWGHYWRFFAVQEVSAT